MNQIPPIIGFMATEETSSRKLINAGSVLMYGSTAIPLGAGRRDSIHLFKESTVLYVPSSNCKLWCTWVWRSLMLLQAKNTNRFFAVRMGTNETRGNSPEACYCSKGEYLMTLQESPYLVSTP
jgi:hypothetical protein